MEDIQHQCSYSSLLEAHVDDLGVQYHGQDGVIQQIHSVVHITIQARIPANNSAVATMMMMITVADKLLAIR